MIVIGDIISLFRYGGSSPKTIAITGVSPLALVNALARPINSLIQYGKCEQPIVDPEHSTPDPDHPIPIWCNNGKLVFGKPVTLNPERYYAYINTDHTWKYSNDSYSIAIPVTVGKTYKIIADPTTPVDGNVQNTILRYGFVDTVDESWKQDSSQSVWSIPVYDEVRSSPQDTQTVLITASHPFLVIQMGASAFASNITNGRISVLLQEVYADGTPETITLVGKNMYNRSTSNEGAYIAADGTITVEAGNMYSDLIPVDQGSYVFSGHCGSLSDYHNNNKRVHGYNTSGEWVEQITYKSVALNTDFTVPFTVSNTNIKFVRLGEWASDSNIMLEKGSTASAYEPYSEQIITDVPNLFGAGSCSDKFESIDGFVYRNCRVYVFDGTENWVGNSNKHYLNMNDILYSAKTVTPYCTHYKGVNSGWGGLQLNECELDGRYNPPTFDICDGDTLANFKARLVNKYISGDPVIAVVPIEDAVYADYISKFSVASEVRSRINSYVNCVQWSPSSVSPSNPRSIYPISSCTFHKQRGQLKYYVDPLISQYSRVLYVEFDFQPSTTYTIKFRGVPGNSVYSNEYLFTSSRYYEITDGINTVTLTTIDIIDKNSEQYTTGRGFIFYKNPHNQSATHKFEVISISDGNVTVTCDEDRFYYSFENIGEPVYRGILEPDRGVIRVQAKKFMFNEGNFQSNWSCTTQYQDNFNAENGLIGLRLNDSILTAAGVDLNYVNSAVCNSFKPISRNNWNYVDGVNTFRHVDGFHVVLHYSDIGLSAWTDNGDVTLNAFYNSSLYTTGYVVFYLQNETAYTIGSEETIVTVGQNEFWCDGNGKTYTYISQSTTETVNPHTMATSKGTNMLFLDAEVDDIQVRAKYIGEPDE